MVAGRAENAKAGTGRDAIKIGAHSAHSGAQDPALRWEPGLCILI